MSKPYGIYYPMDRKLSIENWQRDLEFKSMTMFITLLDSNHWLICNTTSVLLYPSNVLFILQEIGKK